MTTEDEAYDEAQKESDTLDGQLSQMMTAFCIFFLGLFTAVVIIAAIIISIYER